VKSVWSRLNPICPQCAICFKNTNAVSASTWAFKTLNKNCAFRPLLNSDYTNACEMKRLYVQPGHRGLSLGRQLVEQTLLLAQQAGFDTMLLDTLSDMEAARALYQDCGFIEVAPYYHNPLPGAHYLKVEL
jgi:putative acetyltransferase